MTSIDVRATYELLRHALESQNAQHRPNKRSIGVVSADDYSSPDGLLGRFRELERGHSERQPVVPEKEIVPPPPDPEFRQLARIPIVKEAPSIDSSYRSNDQAELAGSLVERGHSPPMNASSQDREWSSTFGGSDLAPRFAPSVSMTTVPVSWRGSRLPIPGPRVGQTQAPQVRAPALPDWWIAATRIGQLFSRGMYGNGGAGDAYRRCIKAAKGSTEDWENFCRFLGRGTSNSVGGESQNRACWSKTFESQEHKMQWCKNQFGGN